jgi:uncharacterized protein (TIGR02611 family)
MVTMRGSKAAKSIAAQVAGWLLVVIGIAALVLPGPGLLALFAGMALLATQYSWAERRLAPVKKAALRAAADSVASTPRTVMSVLGVLALVAVGVVWGLRPEAPGWWPVAERWWLPGGWGTGVTLIGSGVLAGAMVVYSYLHFREPHGEAADQGEGDREPEVRDGRPAPPR